MRLNEAAAVQLAVDNRRHGLAEAGRVQHHHIDPFGGVGWGNDRSIWPGGNGIFEIQLQQPGRSGGQLDRDAGSRQTIDD